MNENEKPESVTRIATGTRIKADIETTSDVHISGLVDGSITTDKKVVISETGKLTGSIEASEALISGKFTGELRVLNHIDLTKSANVDGFIFSKSIAVDEEAVLIGILNVGKEVDVRNAKIEGQKHPEIKKSEQHVPDQSQLKSKQTKSDDEPVRKAEIKPLPPKNRFVAEMLIGIPGEVSEELATTVFEQTEFVLKNLGYELEIFDHPKKNPYYHNLTYVKKSNENQEEIDKKISGIKEVIESSFLKKNDDEAESELQKAAINLTNAINEIDNIAIQIAQILILKFKSDEVQTIVVEEKTEQISETLKADPRKITQPETLYALL